MFVSQQIGLTKKRYPRIILNFAKEYFSSLVLVHSLMCWWATKELSVRFAQTVKICSTSTATHSGQRDRRCLRACPCPLQLLCVSCLYDRSLAVLHSPYYESPRQRGLQVESGGTSTSTRHSKPAEPQATAGRQVPYQRQYNTSRSHICTNITTRSTRVYKYKGFSKNIRRYVLVPGNWYTIFPSAPHRQCRDKKMSHHLTVLQIVPFEMSHF